MKGGNGFFEAPFTFSRADSLKTPFELQVGARARVFKRFGVELGIGHQIAQRAF